MLPNLQENQSGEPLQLVLGTDKRNPLVSVYEEDETQTLHVYYGLELMEVIPADRKHPSYKLLVSRLYNAGVKVSVLSETFDVDRKTMKRWAEALLEGDPEKLVVVLAGRKGKVTAEIEGFVRMRFASVYREHPRNYSSCIRGEIREIFGVSLSGEALRPLFSDLRSVSSIETSEPCDPQEEVTCENSPSETSGESGGQAPSEHDANTAAEVKAYPRMKPFAQPFASKLPLFLLSQRVAAASATTLGCYFSVENFWSSIRTSRPKMPPYSSNG